MSNQPVDPRVRRGRGLALGVAGAAALVVLAVIGYFVIARDDSGGGTPQVSGAVRTPTASSASTAVPSASAPGSAPAASGSAPSASATTSAGADDRWQGERTALGTYLVPPRSEGWSLSNGEAMAYADDHGKVLAKAEHPAYFRAGYCSTGAGVARAWVGFSPTPDGVVESSKAVATAWAGVIGRHDDGRVDPHSPVTSRRLDSQPGMSLTTSRTVLTLLERDQAGCLPPRVEITTVTARTNQDVTTLVLVRDLDVEGQLPDDLRDRILASVRPSTA